MRIVGTRLIGELAKLWDAVWYVPATPEQLRPRGVRSNLRSRKRLACSIPLGLRPTTANGWPTIRSHTRRCGGAGSLDRCGRRAGTDALHAGRAGAGRGGDRQNGRGPPRDRAPPRPTSGLSSSTGCSPWGSRGSGPGSPGATRLSTPSTGSRLFRSRGRQRSRIEDSCPRRPGP